MTREFSLVLLGAGMLTAGSFLWPEENLEEAAKKEADRQVASSTTNTHGRTYYRPLIFFGGFGGGGGMGATSGSPARVSFNRGGFGGTGAHISGLS